MNRSGSIFWTVIAMVSLGGCESGIDQSRSAGSADAGPHSR